MSNLSIDAAESQAPPLCRSYVCIAIRATALRRRSEPGVRALRLTWAVGVLSDRLMQYLGSWEPSGPSCLHGAQAAQFLHQRGVERLRFVVAPDLIAFEAAMVRYYRGATVLPAVAEVLDPFLIDSVDPGHRGYVLQAQEVATTLDRRFRRAASRQGGFADAASAAAVLRRSAQGSLQSGWPARVPSVGCPRALTGLAAG